MNLYQQELMDHYRYPRNQGALDKPSFATEVLNPSCGDQVSFQGIVENGMLSVLKFQGKGCVISQAAASMLAEKAVNQTLETVQAWDKDIMLSLVGISLGPTRLRCALLCLEALHKGLAQYKGHGFSL
jgi:nitrogen fixation protein NifU and related proteins